MAILHIQIQADATSRLVARAIATLLAERPIHHLQVHKGNDRGPYINLHVECRSPIRTWERISKKLNAIRQFRNASIVIGTGRHGWDDYVLLQHFNGESDPG